MSVHNCWKVLRGRWLLLGNLFRFLHYCLHATAVHFSLRLSQTMQPNICSTFLRNVSITNKRNFAKYSQILWNVRYYYWIKLTDTTGTWRQISYDDVIWKLQEAQMMNEFGEKIRIVNINLTCYEIFSKMQILITFPVICDEKLSTFLYFALVLLKFHSQKKTIFLTYPSARKNYLII